jgi:hypothetical protein
MKVNEKGQLVSLGCGLSEHDRRLYGLGSSGSSEQGITQAQVQRLSENEIEEMATNKSAVQAALDDIEKQAGGTGDQIVFLNLQED